MSGDIFGLKKRKSGSGGDIFGLKGREKRSKTEAADAQPRNSLQHSSSFDERADLLGDLLEEDSSVLPLLEAPREVLAIVGAFLDATRLAALGALNAGARLQLEEAFEDSWTALLMRDYMPRQRAKRYRAYGSAAPESLAHGGVVLTAVDINRTEWDGMLLASPSHLRYRFMQTQEALKGRWGRMAQSWEWFASRAMRRTTYDQLERLVPGFGRPATAPDDRFDEVVYQASQDRNLRQRHQECDPSAVIASVKRSLGLPDGRTPADGAREPQAPPAAEGRGPGAPPPGRSSAVGGAEDVLSAMAPTARDQRLVAAASAEEAEASRQAAAAASAEEVPTQEAIERMSFSEQLELALRVSQASCDAEASGPSAGAAGEAASAEASPRAAGGPSPRACTAHDEPQRGEAAAAGGAAAGDEAVLLRLKLPRAPEHESLEVVLRDFTAGESMELPGHLHRSLEQTALRLVRADWLLFYESVAAEAQLRACTAAHWLRARWLPGAPTGARRLVELEAVLLTLPLFGSAGGPAAAGRAEAQLGGGDTGVGAAASAEHEEHVAKFLEAWEEHEAWVRALEEHMGPLDLEVSRERSNNLQHGRHHTPYAADLFRLAFRNFAICEGRLFFALVMAVYGIIARLCDGRASGQSLELLDSLHALARAYSVQDDSLAAQRGTLTEYRYYLLEPLRRAHLRFLPDGLADREDGGIVQDCG